MQTRELMTLLHDMDAALASCQRRAIAADELRRVWDLYSASLQQVEGSDRPWVDVLLRRMATRYGILGLVTLHSPGPPEGLGAA